MGATEERVLGSLDLPELLTAGTARFRPGLLAAADGGVLYVDEINLLADHLVDALLDVAVSGVNRVERDGLSHTHPARFVLVGSMNPEEGELRPQLLDRFGLAAEVAAPRHVGRPGRGRPAPAPGRAPSHGRRRGRGRRRGVAPAGGGGAGPDRGPFPTTWSSGPAGWPSRWGPKGCGPTSCSAGPPRQRPRSTDGRRPELDDVRAVAGLVLAHRRRRRPFDEPGISPEELTEAWDPRAGPILHRPTVPTACGQPEPPQDEPGTERSGSLDPPRRQQASTAAGRFGRAEAPARSLRP